MNVKLEQLSKHFGSVIAVQHMNAVLKPGITGLLGANGSGKTTLLRMMVNVLPPDEGHILYGDIDIREKREEYLANIGYMPQHLGMYPTFRVEEFLQYMGAVKGLTSLYDAAYTGASSCSSPGATAEKEDSDAFRRHAAAPWHCTGTPERSCCPDSR